MFLAIIQRSHDEANRIKRAARFDFSFITGVSISRIVK
jgi:hypothetical protein